MSSSLSVVEKVAKDDDHEALRPKAVKDRFPRIVMVIILTEFCERFSYSGMRAFLTLYLRSKLGYTDDEATETYHVFSTLVYVFPVIGGILADNYLGKFRTILYMMFVYAAGNILVAVTAIPQLAMPGRLCTLIGLFMITIGTGGIKPCVTSFGGDQFELPRQEHHLAVYFSVLYFMLCLGSLIAKTVSPILRAEVHCFGDKDCYSLAFGAPGLIVLVSIVVFVSAKTRYIVKKPQGNVILDFVKCITLGIKNAILNRGKNENTSHWLDTTQHQYDKCFIRDIKKTLSILMLFTVLPVFWALLDQLGSRWTIQATKMDGRFGFVTIKPDQMQVLAPVFILILIPLFQKYLYPFCERRNLLSSPLHKLTLGGVLAGVAFIASGILEIYISTTYPKLPRACFSQLRIYNGNPCSISIENEYHNITYTIPKFSQYKKEIPVAGISYVTLNLGGSCIEPRDERFLLEEKEAVSFFLIGDDVIRYRDHVDKSKAGFPFVRFLNSLNSTNIHLYNERRSEVESTINSTGVSKQMEVFASIYSLKINNETIMDNMELESGGVYAILLGEKGGKIISKLFVITEANSITMAWLLPQFFIISAGEMTTLEKYLVLFRCDSFLPTSVNKQFDCFKVLFAVTGNEFAFKEAPNSMKAVMTSIWLLTDAVGNIIIIVITRIFANYSQETQNFIYTGLMFVSITVFHFLSRGYQFGHPEDEKHKCTSNSQVLYTQVKQADENLELIEGKKMRA